MEIYYLDNSGFIVLFKQTAVVFDCWRFTDKQEDAMLEKGYLQMDVLAEKKRVYLCISHIHADHFNPRIFDVAEQLGNAVILADADIPVPQQFMHKLLRAGDVFMDEYIEVNAWDSTDIGISFQIRMEGKNIFHAGDLNYWHWKEESTPHEIAKAKSAFDYALDHMASSMAGGTDVAFFPIDPRMESDIEAGAREFVKRFSPKWLIPMHFSNNFSRIRECILMDKDLTCQIWVPERRGDHILIETEGE